MWQDSLEIEIMKDPQLNGREFYNIHKFMKVESCNIFSFWDGFWQTHAARYGICLHKENSFKGHDQWDQFMYNQETFRREIMEQANVKM